MISCTRPLKTYMGAAHNAVQCDRDPFVAVPTFQGTASMLHVQYRNEEQRADEEVIFVPFLGKHELEIEDLLAKMNNLLRFVSNQIVLRLD